ncbi:nuclease-related domain-containing protein [Bacillus sp. USDA818B3_A]|uniref:nuclease-related domain-containing protein n=1 Tax=Bacillus sp. USDA818B3_A TaxID=2698834 RepID=UPI00136F6906|nr:nuclease-related domain-containing protein [Bacillus sp. USDA818B3_A]
MVIKELTLPRRLILTEILKKYLKPNHPKYPVIEKELARRWAGYWGEAALANYLKELPSEKYYILHDLQLQLHGIHFQIDTLILTQTYIQIIEAKNIIGTLYFDNIFNQLIRTNPDGTEESFEDPRIQCRRLQSLLGRWLILHNLHLLPIDYLIFFKSSNRTILKTSGTGTDLTRICKGRDLFNKIENSENRYKQVKIQTPEMIEIANFLLSKHTPKQIDILKEYELTETEPIQGVQCSSCKHIPMEYQKGKWICIKCGSKSRDGHIETINDHFLLVKPTITNRECQKILHLPSANITQKKLIALDLPTSGHTKKRVYHQWPDNKSYILIEKKLKG